MWERCCVDRQDKLAILEQTFFVAICIAEIRIIQTAAESYKTFLWVGPVERVRMERVPARTEITSIQSGQCEEGPIKVPAVQ